MKDGLADSKLLIHNNRTVNSSKLVEQEHKRKNGDNIQPVMLQEFFCCLCLAAEKNQINDKNGDDNSIKDMDKEQNIFILNMQEQLKDDNPKKDYKGVGNQHRIIMLHFFPEPMRHSYFLRGRESVFFENK